MGEILPDDDYLVDSKGNWNVYDRPAKTTVKLSPNSAITPEDRYFEIRIKYRYILSTKNFNITDDLQIQYNHLETDGTKKHVDWRFINNTNAGFITDKVPLMSFEFEFYKARGQITI